MPVRWNNFSINLLRETDIKRKIELTQIKKQVEILSTFMPDEILNMSLSELDELHTFVGVLLFADVSGFTPLCERYNKTGKGGIYRLTATLNAYIGALVEVISFYGGDILKFSGDAFLALWKAPPDVRLFEVIHQVIACALFIQSTLGCFETEVNVLLKVKLAIACGNLTFSVIGNEEYRHYIITGQAINDVKNAEHVSSSGDVVVAPSAWGHLAEDNYEVTYAQGGNVKVWNCVYFSNQNSLEETYISKHSVAYSLCVKHLEHRSRLHEKRRFDDATTDSKITESFIASLPERPAVKSAPLRWIPHDLNPFIVNPVLRQVQEKQPIEYLTEMREVTILFINIVPHTYQDSKLVPLVNKAYQIVCKIVSDLKGVVNKVSLFDKDVMILVLFGLRGVEHELESQNALKSGFAIRRAVKKLATVKSISVGITNGLVYCGVVGHPFRREYTVIGGAVNKAARIMCSYEDKVTCDHETYKSCKLSSLYFQLQSVMKLKGIEDAGRIFEYNENFDKMVKEKKQDSPVIGRQMQLELADLIVEYPEKVERRSLCFKGDSKVGKTKLLKTIFDKYSGKMDFMCSVSLNGGLQRPYYCVSALYLQLYNKMSQVLPDVIKDLPRDLWDLNELFQSRASVATTTTVTTVNGANITTSFVDKLHENFMKIIKGDPQKSIIFIVDNIQFIDERSLELLEIVINEELVRLLCSGCFDENTTWNTMCKISLNEHIKVLNIEPLPSTDISLLMCNFLNVKGISKKLIVLIEKTCDGRPGWVQACLLKMINNGELEVKYTTTNDNEYAFLHDVEDTSIVLVAGFSKKYLERSEATSTAVSLDLFDAFAPYEQLIIKTAAVLGEIFTRTILIVLLKYPSESMLAGAIKTLFDEDIFDCASRYVNSGGLQEKTNMCLCYMDDEEYEEEIEDELELPRYALCKVLHFKSRNIRSLAYELLPQNQKRELHLRITDLLENQNNSCPSCLRDNSASIIAVRRFNDLIKYCHDQKYIWSEKRDAIDHPIEVYQDIIRGIIHRPPKEQQPKKKWRFCDLPKRKIWDPTNCFCLEILLKVYKDLIYHSSCGQHLGKKIFFMLEYATILICLQEMEQAIPILHEASELCMFHTSKSYIFTDNFKTMMMGKIHYTLGSAYLKIGNYAAAKNHAIISLRQYNVPIVSFKYTIPHTLIHRACFLSLDRIFNPVAKQDNPLIKLDFASCLSLVSEIYASEGHWNFAKKAAIRSINCMRRTNANIDILCDVYSKAMQLHTFCGDMHICEKLERCFNKDMLKYYTNNITKELFSISATIDVLFLSKILSGNLTQSIQLGYRVLQLGLSIQAYTFLLEAVPLLASVLLLLKRIDDAVYLARLLFNIGKKFNAYGYVGYYSFCIELILETNFCLEPIENIKKFALEYFDPKKKYTNVGNKLIINLYCYYLRKPSLVDAENWKPLCNWEEKDSLRLMGMINLMRFTECALLEAVRNLEQLNNNHNLEIALFYLKKLKFIADRWPFFMPRYLHMKAYYYQIKYKAIVAAKYLKKARKAASQQGNVLEECWISCHSNYWFVGFASDRGQFQLLNWKTARNYNALQWCNVMYPWPYF